jgi:hypothetical protein
LETKQIEARILFYDFRLGIKKAALCKAKMVIKVTLKEEKRKKRKKKEKGEEKEKEKYFSE